MFCPYKNIFGEPRQGVHSLRFMDFAVVDIVSTVVGAWAIHYFTGIVFWQCLLALFLLGIFLHYLFCVETTLNKLLFSLPMFR